MHLTIFLHFSAEWLYFVLWNWFIRRRKIFQNDTLIHFVMTQTASFFPSSTSILQVSWPPKRTFFVSRRSITFKSMFTCW